MTCAPVACLQRADSPPRSYIRFARITFFSVTFRFVVGFIPVSVKIEGFGEAGMYWDLNLINSPDRGGAMLNGVVVPTGVVALTGELAIDIFIARVGLGCQVELLRISLPGARRTSRRLAALIVRCLRQALWA